jgi:hypothetical protein
MEIYTDTIDEVRPKARIRARTSSHGFSSSAALKVLE